MIRYLYALGALGVAAFILFNAGPKPPPAIEAHPFYRDGHHYLIFSRGALSQSDPIGVVHNPECHRCRLRGTKTTDAGSPDVRFFDYRAGVDDKKTGQNDVQPISRELY